MSKKFKYDVVKLIECVRDRPCLWDKTIENYKDRVERRAAWEDIFDELDEDYESMSPEFRRITGELILNKWTNIRDTFVKTLKTKMGKPKKRYLFHDQLAFLQKNVTLESEPYILDCSEDVPVTFMKQESEEGTSYGGTRRRKKVDYSEDYEPPRKSKKSDSEDYTKRARDQEPSDDAEEFDAGVENNIDFVEMNGDQRVMNEDEAFFASLLPTVARYNDDERLEFRIEVLSVMKKIREESMLLKQ